MFDKAGKGAAEGEVEVGCSSAGARKLRSSTSPARKATGNVSGVDLNNSWPKFQNSAKARRVILNLMCLTMHTSVQVTGN
jgi:hypothetical protein